MKCLFQIADNELHSFAFDPIDSRMHAIITTDKALPQSSIIFPGHGEVGYMHEFSL